MSAVGVGWIIWRGQEYLPKDLIFELHYLGEVSSGWFDLYLGELEC